MRRFASIIFVLLVGALLLCACTEKAPEEQDSETVSVSDSAAATEKVNDQTSANSEKAPITSNGNNTNNGGTTDTKTGSEAVTGSGSEAQTESDTKIGSNGVIHLPMDRFDD